MSESVAEVMSVDFVAVSAQMALTDALALLIESETTELCVVDEQGRLQGVITDFDLLKVCWSGRLQNESVESLISRAVTVVSANASLRQVVPLFRDGRCSRAYVCRDGRVVGRITRTQILRHVAALRAESDAAATALKPEATAITSAAEKRPHAAVPPAPRFVTSSLFGNGRVERSSFRTRPSA